MSVLRMRGLLAACLLCALTVLSALVMADICSAGDDRTVLAVVNGEQITVSDYRRFLLKVETAPESTPVSDKLLKKLIEERLILQEARKKRVDITDREVEQSIRDFIVQRKLAPGEFEKTITSRGMSVGDYKKWLKENILVLSKMLSTEVDRGISITSKDLDEYYGQNRQLFVKEPERATVGAVILRMSENPSPEEITGMKMKSLRIVADLKKGEPFGKLALLYSEDVSREREGILGDFKKGELVPVFEEALSALNDNEVSEPIWVKEGVYILKLIKRSSAVFLPLDEVRGTLETIILNERKEKKYSEWIRSLWERASISIQ